LTAKTIYVEKPNVYGLPHQSGPCFELGLAPERRRKSIAKTTTPAEIIANRFEEAGHQRYPAHRLRHAAAQMAVKRAKSTIELKAISQCFGHTTVNLMLSTYGDWNSTQLDEISLNLGNHENGELSLEELQVIALMRKRAA